MVGYINKFDKIGYNKGGNCNINKINDVYIYEYCRWYIGKLWNGNFRGFWICMVVFWISFDK